MRATGEFQVGRELGRGALAVVREMRASDGRVLAGKFFHVLAASRAGEAELPGNHEARLCLEREGDLLAGILHPNVVRVYGMTDIEGQAVLLMERVDGPSLAAVIAREAPLPEARVLAIARGISAGLSAAHAAGLVHRDLKPANVLLTASGEPKIVDFGLAVALALSNEPQPAFQCAGTPEYLAPECVSALAVDERSDLYSLGCILFELLTGRPPFSGTTPLAVLRAHAEEPLHELGPTEVGVRALVRDLLAKRPGDRPQSADAVTRRIDALQEGGPLPDLATLSRRRVEHVRCLACEAEVVAALGTCIACGRRLLALEPGAFSVVVTGSGRGKRLEVQTWGKLVKWLRHNFAFAPGAGDAVVKRAPIVPCVLLSGIDEDSAERVAQALRALGLDAEAHDDRRGRHLALARLRRSVISRQLLLLPLPFALVGVLRPGWVFVLIFFSWLGRTSRVREEIERPLLRVRLSARGQHPAAPLDAALHRAADALSSIEHRRHRESLAALAERAIALRAMVATPAFEADLAEVVTRAANISLALDAIDARIERDRNVSAVNGREGLRDRTRLASHLFALGRAVDNFTLRVAIARAKAHEADVKPALDAFEAEVQALAEVRTP